MLQFEDQFLKIRVEHKWQSFECQKGISEDLKNVWKSWGKKKKKKKKKRVSKENDF